MKKETNKKSENRLYAYYSKVLKEPFDTIEELAKAEEAYYAKLKAKEAKAASKKADAMKVEEAFKNLNAARRSYKEDLTELTKQYSNELTEIKKTFEYARDNIKADLANAEESYSKALREFTDAHPEGYHVTLKDGDFETTISHKSTINTKKVDSDLYNLFDMLFGF